MRFVLAAAAVIAAGGCAGGAHPAYWTVERNGKTSILFGTMHAEVDVDALAPELFDKLASARVLITEADVRDIDDAEFQASIALPQGESVQAHVSDDEWSDIEDAIRGMASPLTVDHEQPWFTEGFVVGNRLPPVEPIEAGLVSRAIEHGVALEFFETWQEQVAVLNGLGLDDGAAALVRTAADPGAAVAEHLAWADVYERGDVDGLVSLAFDPGAIEARPAYYADVVGRHARWLDRVDAAIDSGDAFIAAGFMHMLTDDGLPARLAERGDVVTQH